MVGRLPVDNEGMLDFKVDNSKTWMLKDRKKHKSGERIILPSSKELVRYLLYLQDGILPKLQASVK